MSLEDKILKKNIPGRYSSWDSAERHEGTIEEEEEDNSSYSYESHPSCVAESIHDASSYPKTCRTGVKGVLADYKREKQNQEYIRTMEDLETQRLLLTPQTIMTDTAISSNTNNHLENDSSSNDSENEEEDDVFLKNYREKRLLQLQVNKDWPMFGQVQNVNAIEFAETVDDLDPRVFCVIHLYEECIPDCKLLDSHLALLAQCMPYCCFLRLQATAAKRDFDLIALPSVLIYRNRVLVANLTPITASLSHMYPTRRLQSFTMEDIQHILESYGIVDPKSDSSTK